MEFKIRFETYNTFKYKLLGVLIYWSWVYVLLKCIKYNLTSTSVQAFALHLYWFCGSRVVVPIFLWFFGFISFTHRFLNRFCDLFFLFNPISRGLQISVLSLQKICFGSTLPHSFICAFLFWREKNQKSIFLRAIITFVYLTTEQYPITITLKYLIQL